MKVTFNDFIKHNDVVIMPLYRRVFPVWYPRSWDPSAPTGERKEEFDAEVEEKDTMTD